MNNRPARTTTILLFIWYGIIALPYSVNAQVGIGTLAPQAGLHVADSSGVLFSAPYLPPGTIPPAPEEGDGRRLMWYPAKAAFRVGLVSGDKWDTHNIGHYSFAGSQAKATNNMTFAFGDGAVASGFTAIALGSAAEASGLGAITLGFNSTSSGDDAVAIGYANTAAGTYSMALGTNNNAGGNQSTIIGHHSIAGGNYSVAMGNGNNANGLNSTSIGYYSISAGEYSVAIGRENTAYGHYSTAVGYNSTAYGNYATAIGRDNSASGSQSIAIGSGNTSSGLYATAVGFNSTASGNNSFAMGDNAYATGNYSVAMGRNVNTAVYSGTFIFSDASPFMLNSTATNQMTMRFSGGYQLYTNSAGTIGVSLASNGNSWATLSDSTRKENFKHADGRAFLSKIKNMKLGSWNYKGEDKTQNRHYGPMAQEFYSLFGNDGMGTIGNDTTIAAADIDGVIMIAIRALAEENVILKQKLANQEMDIAELHKKIDIINKGK